MSVFNVLDAALDDGTPKYMLDGKYLSLSLYSLEVFWTIVVVVVGFFGSTSITIVQCWTNVHLIPKTFISKRSDFVIFDWFILIDRWIW